MKLTKLLVRFFGVLGLLIPGVAFPGDPPPVPPCPDGITCFDLTYLTPLPATATINGAIYSVPPTTLSTGSGAIDSFVRVQNTGSEQGYNTSDYASEPDLQFDEKAGTFTHDLLYSALLTNTVTVNGIEYIEFVLDINQTTANPYISLDQLKIYSGPDQATNTLPGDYENGNLGALSPIYDLDAGGVDRMVMLNYLNYGGSGDNLDMLLLIPKALFCNTPPGTSPNAPNPCITDTNAPLADQTHVYLYSQFGTSAGFETNDGFEEWAHKVVGTFTPEPGAIALLLIGLAAFGLTTRRRPIRNVPHAAMC